MARWIRTRLSEVDTTGSASSTGTPLASEPIGDGGFAIAMGAARRWRSRTGTGSTLPDLDGRPTACRWSGRKRVCSCELWKRRPRRGSGHRRARRHRRLGVHRIAATSRPNRSVPSSARSVSPCCTTPTATLRPRRDPRADGHLGRRARPGGPAERPRSPTTASATRARLGAPRGAATLASGEEGVTRTRSAPDRWLTQEEQLARRSSGSGGCCGGARRRRRATPGAAGQLSRGLHHPAWHPVTDGDPFGESSPLPTGWPTAAAGTTGRGPVAG